MLIANRFIFVCFTNATRIAKIVYIYIYYRMNERLMEKERGWHADIEYFDIVYGLAWL